MSKTEIHKRIDSIPETCTAKFGGITVRYAYLSQRGYYPDGKIALMCDNYHWLSIMCHIVAHLNIISLICNSIANPQTPTNQTKIPMQYHMTLLSVRMMHSSVYLMATGEMATNVLSSSETISHR